MKFFPAACRASVVAALFAVASCSSETDHVYVVDQSAHPAEHDDVMSTVDNPSECIIISVKKFAQKRMGILATLEISHRYSKPIVLSENLVRDSVWFYFDNVSSNGVRIANQDHLVNFQYPVEWSQEDNLFIDNNPEVIDLFLPGSMYVDESRSGAAKNEHVLSDNRTIYALIDGNKSKICCTIDIENLVLE